MLKIDPAFFFHLRRYHFPGNIRELKNIIERAVILADGDGLTEETLPDEVFRPQHKLQPEQSLLSQQSPVSATVPNRDFRADSTDLKSVEQEHILRILSMVNGNKSEAAKRLDIGLATLYRKLKEYNVT